MLQKFINNIRENRLKRLESRLKWEQKVTNLKSQMRKNSHSLLWIWEFSKKVVLICFGFYIATWVYSMIVMAIFQDFSCLGELINGAKDILENCVFGYFVKAGIENVAKIVFSHDEGSENEHQAEG